MSRSASTLDRASAALNRSSSSFIGRKSLLDSETSDDAAELNRFLSGLSQRTNPAGKTKHAHSIPSGLSDISISSDEEYKNKKVTPQAGPRAGGNKFLKTPKPANATAVGPSAANSKSLPTKSVTSGLTSQSPALLRLSEHAQKFMGKSNASLGSTMPRQSTSLYVSEDSTIISETSESVGAKGNMFLKSKQPKTADKDQSLAVSGSKRHRKTPIPAQSLRTSTEDDSDMAAYIQGLSPSASEVSDDENIAAKKHSFTIAQQPSLQKKGPPSSTAAKDDSSFATETFTDGSSIASNRNQGGRTPEQFSDDEIATDSEGPLGGNVMDIEALSLQPSTSKPHSQPATKSSNTKPKVTKPAKKQTQPESKKPVQSALSSLGLMSIDDLVVTRDSSVRTASPDVKSIRTESSIKSYRRSDRGRLPDSDSSIHTYKESVKTESVGSEVKTHSSTRRDDYASDFDDTLRETDSIHTDDSRRSSRSRTASSYSSRFSSRSRTRSGSRSSSRSRSYTRSLDSRGGGRISHSRSRSLSTARSRSRTRSRSRSRSRSVSRSRTRSRSLSRSRSRSLSRSQSGSRSHGKSRSEGGSSHRGKRSSRSSSPGYSNSFIEDHTESQISNQEADLSSEIKGRRVRVESVDTAVQTGVDLDEMILKYYWMTDEAHPSIRRAATAPETLTDPPRVAKMAVSNDALEVLTTYNPAMLALNEMIKQQVELSKQFLNIQKDMHKNIMSSIERQHTYTTLEDTKQFIESRRKPKLTFEQALAMVKEEMGL